MTNKKSLLSISPDVAASIQECLTKNIESSLLFYHNSFGNKIKPRNVLELYSFTVGIPCGNDVCFTSLEKIKNEKSWKCDKDNIHDTKYLLYWIFDKNQQMCDVGEDGCTGLSSDDLGTEPSDKHLVRLCSQIGIHSFKQFFVRLGMTPRQWENTEDMYCSHSREGIISMALGKWKESKLSNQEKPTLNDLAEALTAANLNTHFICQVFRENTKLFDIADLKLQEPPSDDVLKTLSNQIGNCALQLGIELGISFYEVEKSVVKFPKDLSGLIEDILKKWKATSKIKTTHSLMMALLRVDGGGVQYLHKITK
ncbi:uncharacterized protein LOC143052876 [Mytilus galloprovincialis]|uniref:uncharacterized protein LOC143052876 n=1 Tax=Mytilus galloprovincialis TaxID=29158 RepID=UPI003F7C158A